MMARSYEGENPRMSHSYGSLITEVRDQVATIKMLSVEEGARSTPPADIHWDLQAVLNELREDHSVRVIVITGAHDGEFLVPRPTSRYTSEWPDSIANPNHAWKLMVGIIRLHTTMAEIEKPILAKVNGDAIGFGQSVMFSSDLIVARQDAVVSDVHLSQGTVLSGQDRVPVGSPFGTVPGDGAGATVPLFMPPVKAKEYLMLSTELTAAELAAMNCINYAVPAEDLDAISDDLVKRLLSKSAFALAWTKRVANRHVIDQLNKALDAGVAYEMINLAQIQRLGSENAVTLTE
jgi:enoyl-CoA hydratase